MKRRILSAAGAACILAALLALTAATSPADPARTTPGPLARGCYRVTIAQNSGNGPFLHWVICYALPRPSRGRHWVLVNDASGSLGNGTVLMGEQVPDR